MPTILIFHPSADAFAMLLRRQVPDSNPLVATNETDFRRHLPEAEVLIAFQFPVDALATATQLRWIQITSAGTEFLWPVRAQIGKRMVVTNSRGIHAGPVADYVLTAAMMLLWDWPELLRDQTARRWRRRPLPPLAGRTFGIVGLGSIGREVARRAIDCGMTVTAVSKSGAPIPGIVQVYRPDELHRFLGDCDFVVLTVPATAETNSMISGAEFRAMKSSAFIINVSRGTVVDETAMIEALQAKTIAGACLDVFRTEPLPPDSPLWTSPNVVITPHIAGMRIHNEDRVMDIFVDNLQRFRRGEPLRNVVDLARGY